MPVTIKAANLKYKDTNGEYVGVNSVSDMTTAEQLAAINQAGTTNKNAVDTAGTNHLSAINAAGTNHLSAINTAGTTQTTAVNNAGSTQVAAVNSAGATQVAAVHEKGDEVLDSIPSDYSELTEDVNSLKSEITELEPKVDSLEINKADVIINTASGSIASFSDGADDLPVKSLSVAIEPVQDLHGYDHPWPEGGGNNKWDEEWELGSISTETGANINSTTIIRSKNYTPVVENQTYCIVKNTNPGSFYIIYYKSDYTFNGVESIGGSTNYKELTIPADTAFLRIRFGNTYGTNYNNDVAINSPSSVTTYAPYSNICPISGFDSVKVMRTGRNLWNPEDYAPLTLIDDPTNIYYGFYAGSVANWANTYPDNHKAEYGRISITATIGCYDGASSVQFTFRIYFFYDDGTFDYPGGNIYAIAGQVTTITRTSTASKNCIGYSIGTSAGVKNLNGRIKDVTVTLYGDDTTYVEPDVQSVTLQLGQTVYGGELTVNEDGTGKLVVDRGEIDLGNYNYSIVTLQGKQAFRSTTSISGIKGHSTASSITHSICERYLERPEGIENGQFFIGATIYSYANRITIRDDAYSDATAFKTAVTGTKLVYPLAAPQTFTLTASQVQTLLGVNNVWSDAGDVAVSYRADTKIYIDNKITQAIAAALNS